MGKYLEKDNFLKFDSQRIYKVFQTQFACSLSFENDK